MGSLYGKDGILQANGGHNEKIEKKKGVASSRNKAFSLKLHICVGKHFGYLHLLGIVKIILPEIYDF